MIHNKNVLALIPARGGSKLLQKKNILDLNNKPIIKWSIDAARNSKYIDDIIVSTDNDEIFDISKKYGARVPFKRPFNLATDNSKSIDVILHAISWLKNNKEQFNILVLLQPTSPLRTGRDIDDALELLFEKNAESIISVCKTEHSPLWTNELPKDRRMNNFLDKKTLNKNRQELPDYFRLNGAIYIAYVKCLEDNKSFFGENTFAYVMPQDRSIDIDSKIDLELCKVLLNINYK